MLAPVSDDVLDAVLDEVAAAVIDELIAPFVPGAPTPPKTPPRQRHPALAVDYSWLLDARPTDNDDHRGLWVWWRGVGLRGQGRSPRPTACGTDGCGRAPAAGRRVCEWCAHNSGPRVWREGNVEIKLNGSPTRTEIDRRDTPAAYDAWHEWHRVLPRDRDDEDETGDDAHEAWVYAHALDVGGDPYDDVCDRVDRDRAARRRRW